ncbi:MAG: bacillithiol biosynthesis cysteine-adding enzyme BshC [Flavobacterium sp.]|nr:bacillithiol biosynthesis cysteine-adding enzyme BshC [Flavobacterium sp.]
MPSDCISYQKSGFFTKLIVDYLDENPQLQQFYNRFPKLENFKLQIEEKDQTFTKDIRQILVTELEKQYTNVHSSLATEANIKLLKDSNTFSITTGHQLNLFTGPLYFLYKIVSTINLCKALKKEYPEFNFVPIYWMATEDHDFKEINYFELNNRKIKWDKASFGPVGRLSTKGLEQVFENFSSEIGIGENANYLKKIFQTAYLENSNLADATRVLANELFKNEGLVIIDGDSINLKKLFIPYVKEELLNQTSFQKVSQTIVQLKEYTIQVNPREINLFYIENNSRERIIYEHNKFKINNTKIEFSESQILEELQNFPEKFSPNVILRPLYQEVILPNLCYIGGGGEIAYWLELKSNFEYNKVTFPILLIRNSVLLSTQKQIEKIDNLQLSWADLFLNQQELFTRKTKEFSKFSIDLSEQKNQLKLQFEKLYAIALETDKSFVGAVKAQETKQINGLQNLEKRLLKAEKRVHVNKLERILLVQNELFPNQSLQERKLNYSKFYVDFGDALFDKLFSQLNPLDNHFTIIKL